MLPIPIIFSMLLITLLLPEPYCAITPALQAVFEPSDGDVLTENDNATYPWTVHVTYTGRLSFTAARKKVGSYSLKANHTGGSTNFWLKVDLGSDTDVSAYWAISFWIKIENKTGYPKINVILTDSSFPSTNTGNMYSYQLYVEDSTWYHVVAPLNLMTKGGSATLTNIRYITFYISSISASDYATFYFDGLHFMDDSADPTITNSLDKTALANLYTAYLSTEMLQVYNSSSYTGLSDWMTYATGAQNDGNLDTESLGQTIFILSYLNDLTGWDFYLDKAKIYADWLLNFQNQTYGYVWYAYDNVTETFFGDPSPAVTGWALAGMSYLYGKTGNITYKDSADKMRCWLCDCMWNGAGVCDAGWFTEWNHTGANGYGTVAYQGMDAGGAMAGLGTYYAKVTQNSSVKNHMDWAYSRAYCLHACRCSGTGGRCSIYWGTTETTAYHFWGFYMMSLSNSSYWDNTVKYAAQYLMASNHHWNNGSISAQFGTYFQTQNSFYKMMEWALSCNLELAYRASKLYDTSSKVHIEKVLRDTLASLKGNYWLIRFDNLPSTTRSWSPTALFFYTALLHYYLDKVNQPFAVSTDANLISSTYSYERLTLTINGTSSTTRVYCGDKGKPIAVYAVNGNVTWSYDVGIKMLTLNVTHECSTRTLIYWKLPGDVDGNDIVDIFDIGSISAHWYPGPPIGPSGYDANYDLNLDGAIDIYEIGIACADWG